MTGANNQNSRAKDRIPEIDRRVGELDALLGKNVQNSIANDVNNPLLSSESEMQYWQDRREERRLLLEERQRLTNPTSIH
jgi:hypothetical protein